MTSARSSLCGRRSLTGFETVRLVERRCFIGMRLDRRDSSLRFLGIARVVILASRLQEIGNRADDLADHGLAGLRSLFRLAVDSLGPTGILAGCSFPSALEGGRTFGCVSSAGTEDDDNGHGSKHRFLRITALRPWAVRPWGHA